MTTLAMSLIAGELSDPILGGEVSVEGPAAWTVDAGPSVDQNSRSMLDGRFDVAEMSIATFLKARDQGRDLIGLPIFTGRGFLQPGMIVSAASGISRPEDLAGKRVSVPQYWMTSSVWHRGILAQQHGVSPERISWLTASEERFEGAVFPAGVSIERLPDGVSPNAALERGLVDAMMIPPRGVPKQLAAYMRSPYPDLIAAERAYVAATGVFPIMHFVVMRASLQAKFPWLADALFAAFSTAKDLVAERGALQAPLPELDDDPFAYGVAKNQRTLDTFLTFARGQGWVSNGLRLADCFVRG